MLELRHGFGVVDVNARLDPDERSVVVHRRGISPEYLEHELHQTGVVCAVVSPSTQRVAGSYPRPNNAVVRISVDHSFLAFARVNGPRDPSDRASVQLRNFRSSRADHHVDFGNIEQYAHDNRLHGFPLASAVDELLSDKTLAMLEGAGLPVFVEGEQAFEPSAVTQSLLGRFPVILSGFGGLPPSRGLMDEVIDLSDDHEDLYLNTSFIRYRSVLEHALLEHPDRTSFGGGAPKAHPNVGVVEILALDVSEDVLTKTFSKNAARVITALGPREQ